MWNTELISSITVGAAATVPIILALVQMVKLVWSNSDKYAPFLSIGFGVLISFLLAHDTGDMSANILAGILFGLAASGLYSGMRATAHTIKAERRKDIMRKDKLQQQQQQNKNKK